MALDIVRQVSAGFKMAKALVPTAFVEAVVRLGPKSVVDPVLDAAVVTWDVAITTDVFGYDDADERQSAPAPGKRQRTFLLDAAEYPPGAKFSQEGQVDIPTLGEVWDVYRAEVSPGAAVVILYARR